MRQMLAAFLLTVLTVNFLQSELIKFYKKGTIPLNSSPGFGKNVDWHSLFYDTIKEIAVAPDGSIFVSNSRKHNVYRFTPEGRYAGSFGQKGQGPGDMYYPGKLSILNDKYLIVGEYASSMRVSIFDLNGNFVKIIKTSHPVHSPIALKQNKIAYLTYTQLNESKQNAVRKTSVVIKDISSGKEKLLTSFEIPDKGSIRVGRGVIKLGNFVGEVIIARTGNCNLLVGASNIPELKVYSPDGQLLNRITLSMSQVPITDKYIDNFKSSYIASIESDPGADKNYNKRKMQLLKNTSFAALFGKHLPFYRDILIDSEDNILVFKWTSCVRQCPKIFQVYSPGGAFICETRLEENEFDFEIDSRFKNLIFTSNAIVGLFQFKNSDDISLRIVKVDIH